MIKKYNSFEEARQDQWEMNPDQAYYRRAFEFLEFMRELTQVKIPPGVYKFKTIEEAQAHRATWKRRQVIDGVYKHEDE